MNQDVSATPSPMPERPRKSNTWIIILIAAVVLCCLCLIVAWAAWTYGDPAAQWFQQFLGATS